MPAKRDQGRSWRTVLESDLRLIRATLALLLVIWLVVPAGAQETDLKPFARSMGLVDVTGFVDVVTTLRRTGRLPERYLTKQEADRRGWRPGSDLCRVADGAAIGGSRFGNYERRLPEKRGRRFYEADLDFNCGRRGAKRLVWSNDGQMFVTVDHYETFHAVPK